MRRSSAVRSHRGLSDDGDDPAAYLLLVNGCGDAAGQQAQQHQQGEATFKQLTAVHQGRFPKAASAELHVRGAIQAQAHGAPEPPVTETRSDRGCHPFRQLPTAFKAIPYARRFDVKVIMPAR
ncbi:MAG: hypothetical protein CMQ24_09840 [Gammaproteobacteria bacterium]|nr:hypothetical protein [Gammaproteobacteria bacterium]